MEAFTYCWTDFGTNKLYVGVHKGTLDDGYVCSSKLMLEEYTKRPNDFSRQIIAFGTYPEMYVLETAILEAAKADRDPRFYNMHVNNGKCYRIGPQSQEERDKKREQMRGQRRALGNKMSPKNLTLLKERMKGNSYSLGKHYKRTLREKEINSSRMMGNKWALGYKHPLVQCPHCNTEGGLGGMTRYHFSNCKRINP